MKLTEELKNDLLIEVEDLIKENAEGTQFIRIKLYPDEMESVLTGEKEYSDSEIVGAHTFSGSNWDDIEASEMIELISFEQDEMDWVENSDEGDTYVYKSGDWLETDTGRNWMEEQLSEVENVLKALM